MIINKLDRLNIQRQSGSGNYRIIATVRDTVDNIDNEFNELNSQNSNLIISNRYNVVTERDCVSIFFSGNIGDIFTITYQQWVVLLGEESYYNILIDTVTLQETTKLYYFRDDLVVDSYSIGEVDALLALKANTEHTHTIADIDDLNTTLSIIESDILLKADIDHNHDADYHPLNGSVNVGAGSWSVIGNSGLLFAVEQDNNNVFSTVPIYDESVSPRQGIIHTNRPNLDSINQNLATTDTVIFGKVGINTLVATDRMIAILNSFPVMDTTATRYYQSVYISGYTSMASGVTNSGYSAGLVIGSSLKQVNHLGHEANNYGIHVQHGTYSDCAGTVGLSVGLYLSGYHNPDTITDHIGIYQVAASGQAARNVFQGKTIIGGTANTTSAKLEITGTDGALLLPRLTTTQRNALTPANGMMIYNTTDNKFQGYANGAWVNLH